MKKELAVVGGMLAILFFLIILLGIFYSGSSSASFGAPRIAVIPLQGEIVSSSQSDIFSEAGSREIVESIEEADSNPGISAILLDIDSPGGSIVATKEIVRAVRAAKKPVVSWIADSGASGAYYAASASDYIVADSDSITGSIGVISIFPNIEELLQKLGIKMEVIKEGENKALGSPFEELTAEQKQIIQTILSEAFQGFKQDVLEFRSGKIDAAAFESIADGRILSGRQALNFGLIDSTSSRKDALRKAAELSGSKGEPVEVFYGRQSMGLLDLFFSAGKSFGTGFKRGLIQPGEITIKS